MSNVANNNMAANGNGGFGGKRTTRIFRSAAEANDILSAEVLQFYPGAGEVYNQGTGYSALYSSWNNGSGYHKETKRETHTSEGRSGERYYDNRTSVSWTTCDGLVSVTGQGYHQSKKEATNMANWMIMNYVARKKLTPVVGGRVVVEMESYEGKEEPGGKVLQVSEREGNTIVTRDQGETRSEQESRPYELAEQGSSEKMITFDDTNNRFVPLDVIPIDTSMKAGTLAATITLPLDIMQKKSIPALLPLNQFVFGAYEFEMKFVVNANKMHCGKVVASVVTNPNQRVGVFSNHQSAVGRNHVMLDLAANTEGTLRVPFSYHRAVARNVWTPTMALGVRPGVVACVLVHVYSVMMTGPGGSSTLDIRPYIRVVNGHYAGMSQRAEDTLTTQMDNLIESLIPIQATRAVLKGVETTLDQLGRSRNQDKPTKQDSLIVVPRPRVHFSTGKGLADSSVLQMNPYALPNFGAIRAREEDPKTVLDIARIFGMYKTFSWAASDKHDTELASFAVDPCLRSYTADFDSAPTNVEFVTGMYAFWSGTVEFRFDFVSNSFHTGSVMISAEYERTGGLELSMSSYTKTVHLGEQKSFTFTVPYIHDSPMRRSSGATWNMWAKSGVTTSDNIRGAAASVRQEVKVRLKVTVINELVPVAAAPQEINVLVFMRAGEDYALHGLKQSSYIVNASQPWKLHFPRDYVRDVDENSFKNVSGTPTPKQTILKRQLKGFTQPTQWMGVKPTSRTYTQMDTGDKETEKITEDFRPGRVALPMLTCDSQIDIMDILRRPVLIMENQVVKSNPSSFFIPVSMVTQNWVEYANKIANPTEWCGSLLMTPQCNLGSCFGSWRGNMRYNIIVHTPVDSPVYITFLPHSGIHVYGNSNMGMGDENRANGEMFHRPYATGAFVELLMTKLNPTTHVEVPYCSENYWTLNMAEDGDRLWSWRDKGDFNAGHVLISCDEEIKVSVWQSLGDAAEVADFRGVPYCTSNDWAYTYNDEAPKVTASNKQALVTLLEPLMQVKEIAAERVNLAATQMDAVSLGPVQLESYLSAANRARETQLIKELNSWREGRTKPYTEEDAQDWAVALQAKHDYFATWGDRRKYRLELEVILGKTLDFWPNGSKDTSLLSSNKLVVEMDSLSTMVAGMMQPRVLGRAAIMSLPIVGPGLVGSQVVEELHNVTDKIGSTVSKTEEAAGAIEQAAQKLGFMADTASLSMGVVTETITKAVEEITRTTTSLRDISVGLVEVLIDLAQAWLHKSWSIVGTSLVKVIIKFIPGTSLDKLIEHAMRIGRYLANLTRGIRTEIDTEVETWAGIVAGVVGTIVGATIDPRRVQSIPRAILERLTTSSGVAYLNQMMRFVNSTIRSVVDALMGWCGYLDPSVHALQMLQGKSEVLHKFIQAAHEVTNEANSTMMLSPRYRTHFWFTYAQALQIEKLLINLPDCKVSPQLSRLCQRVITSANERFVDMSASPVRFEPFVMCFEGPPGIGKSYANEEVCARMLESIGFTRPGTSHIFTRSPGKKFWDGYDTQPVILYDDWLNLSTENVVEQQISELYQLKTTATFTPDMAHLEEKRRKGNPIVVALMTNDAFPRGAIANVAHHIEAIYRRRDVVIRVRMKQEYEGQNPRDIPTEVTQNMGHLEYSFYSARNGTNGYTLGEFCGYEGMLNELLTRFKAYYAKEEINVKNRVARVQQHMYGAETHMLNIEDPFQLFYTAIGEASMDRSMNNGWLPSHALAYEVERVARLVSAHQDQALRAEMDSIPSWIARDVMGGFFSSPRVLGRIISAARDCLREVVEWSLPTQDDTAECCVCLEFRRVQYSCHETYPRYLTEGRVLESHFVCRQCYLGLETANRIGCPICRGELGTTRMLAAYTRVESWVATCIRAHYSFDKILEFAERFISYSYNRVTDVCDVLATLGLMCMRDPSQFLYIGKVLGNVAAQSDNGDEAGPSSGAPRVNPVLYVGIDEQGFYQCRDGPETGVPCMHAFLEVNGSLRYRNDKWSQVLDGPDTPMVAPDKTCGRDCVWQDERRHREFYLNYAALKKFELQRLISYYISDGDNKECFKVQIPRALRPSWMHDNAVSQEVDNITSPGWWEALTGVIERFKVFLRMAGAIVAVVGCILGGQRVYNYLTQAHGESEQYDEQRRPARRHVRVNRKPIKYFRARVQQENANPSIEDVIAEKIAANYVTVRVVNNGAEKYSSVCGIRGHTALLPRHYLRVYRQPGVRIFLRSTLLGTSEVEYFFDDRDFVTSEHTDLAAWTFPSSYPLFKDLVKYFARDEDLGVPLESVNNLLVPPTRRDPEFHVREVECVEFSPSEVVWYDDGLGGEQHFTARDIILYDFSCPGACGAILYKRKGQRPLFGMHFAGLGSSGRGSGRGVIITQESISEILTPRTVFEMEDGNLGPVSDGVMVFAEECNIEYLGSLPRHLTPFLPKKTKLRKSEIFGEIGYASVTEPAILDRTDPRWVFDFSPLWHGVSKHGALTIDFRTSELESVREALWDGWFANMRTVVEPTRRFTPEEAAVGIPGNERYKHLVLATSAGWPYNTTQDKLKSDFITFEVNEQMQPIEAVIDSKVIAEIERKEALRRQGIVPFSPFVDTLKDERKGQAKLCKPGGTRVFCNGQLDYLIALRQNFMHFTASFMDQRHELMHAVGINCMSNEWTQLAMRLLKHGPTNIVTIDYSNFGPGFNAGVASMAGEIMIRWTLENVQDVDEQELRCLVEECIHSAHIVANTVYRQKCGSPSGAGFTTEINSLVNILYVMLAWKALVSARDIWTAFRDNVELCVYGDDLIMSVSEVYIGAFNGKTIQDYFRKHAIVSTSFDKTGLVKERENLYEVQFLKRGFAKHELCEFLYVPVFDWKTLVEVPQWIHECEDHREATTENCDAAMWLSFGHGKRKFDVLKGVLNRALRVQKCRPILIQWEDIDAQSFEY